MSIQQCIIAGLGQGGGYTIPYGVVFDGSADHFAKTFSVAGNRKTWTYSVWTKKSELGTDQPLLSAYNGSANTRLGFYAAENLTFYDHSGSYNIQKVTSGLHRDPTAWTNWVCALDTPNDTARLWKDGVEVTAFSTDTDPSTDLATVDILNTVTHWIGKHSAEYFGGYMAECIMLDGTASTDATEFGEFDANGNWQPIDPSGLVDTVGASLISHSDGSNLGNFTSNGGLAAVFDGNTSQASGSGGSRLSSTSGWMGKDYGDGNGKAFAQAIYISATDSGAEATDTWHLEGSDTGAWGGEEVLLGSTVGNTGTGASTVIASGDTTTTYRYIRCFIEDAGSVNRHCGEMQFYEQAVIGFGTNGFHLDFADADNLGLDVQAEATLPGTCLFQCSFDGSDTDTSSTDESSAARTITFAGDAQIDTAQSKFGGSSLICDGTGDYVHVPDHADFDWTLPFTVECWIRLPSLAAGEHIFTHGTDGSNYVTMWFHASSGLFLEGYFAGGAQVSQGATTGWSTDTWYHVAMTWDGTTLRGYRDGVQLCSGTGVQFGNYTGTVQFGGDSVVYTESMNGWLDEARIYSGCLYPDGTTFTPPAAAFDAPENLTNNSWTPVSITSTQQVTDTPSNDADNDIGNFCTLNPLEKVKNWATGTITEGNTRAYSTVAISYDTVGTTITIPTDNIWWYWEVKSENTGFDYPQVGVSSTMGLCRSLDYFRPAVAEDPGYAVSMRPEGKYYTGTSSTAVALLDPNWATSAGDIMQFRFNGSTGEMQVSVNDGSYTSVQTLGDNGPWMIYVVVGDSEAAKCYFGAEGFNYTPTAGDKALNTANLPDPAIPDPTDGFVLVEDTETNIEATLATARTGWGSYLDLYKNTSNSEVWVHQFSHDGSNEYTVATTATYQSRSTLSGSDVWMGYSIRIGSTYGSAAGSQAHTNGAGDTTVTHNLGNARGMILLYPQANGEVYLYHPDVDAGSLLKLTENNIKVTSTFITNVTANSFDIGSGHATDTYDYIICTEIPGFFALRGYEGNANADGPYIDLGHRSAMFLYKEIDTATSHNWGLADRIRGASNVVGGKLFPDDPSAGQTTANEWDIYAGAIKVKGTGTHVNGSAKTHVVASWAAMPVQAQSRAR